MPPKLSLLHTFRIDEHTTFRFGTRNGHKNAIFININGRRESSNKKDRLEIYTKDDLKNYHKSDKKHTTLRYDDHTGFVIDDRRELIFIPLSNDDGNIVQYGITDLKFYDKLKIYLFIGVGIMCGLVTLIKICTRLYLENRLNLEVGKKLRNTPKLKKLKKLFGYIRKTLLSLMRGEDGIIVKMKAVMCILKRLDTL